MPLKREGEGRLRGAAIDLMPLLLTRLQFLAHDGSLAGCVLDAWGPGL